MQLKGATLATILCFAALPGPLMAQEANQAAIQPNTVYVGADGRYEAAPDTALIRFNISAQESGPHGAYDHASKAAEQIRQVLRKNGIDPAQAQIGFFSLQPVYDYSNSQHKIVGYQVNSAVTVKLTDFGKIASIVSEFADIDVAGNESISYTLDNMDSAKQKAIEDAYRKAHDSAETVARSGERSLGTLLYASVDTNERVMPIFSQFSAGVAKAQMAAPAPTEQFSPQKIEVQAHVNALFSLK